MLQSARVETIDVVGPVQAHGGSSSKLAKVAGSSARARSSACDAMGSSDRSQRGSSFNPGAVDGTTGASASSRRWLDARRLSGQQIGNRRAPQSVPKTRISPGPESNSVNLLAYDCESVIGVDFSGGLNTVRGRVRTDLRVNTSRKVGLSLLSLSCSARARGGGGTEESGSAVEFPRNSSPTATLDGRDRRP